MTKKKVNCHYELLCLFNEKEKNTKKYEKMMTSIENMIGKENVKVEEKDWKPAEKVKKLDKGSYVLIYFNSERKKAEELNKNILQSVPKEFLNRYELLNLTDEKRNKIKLIKKTDKLQQPNKDAK